MSQGNDTKQLATVLIVDDDAFVRESLRDILEFVGYDTLEAGDGKTALGILTSSSIDLVLLDLEMPRVSGIDVLRRTVVEHPEIPVVIVSGKGTIQTAVETTKLGAYDFLEKPVEAERTLLTVRNALEKASLQIQRDRLLAEARRRYQMVGSGPAMQRIYRLIDRAAAVQSRVLVTGESGTGKELIARAIHYTGNRAVGPFVAVNCAAIPEDLIESELFGIQGRVATGVDAHIGKFEQADGGTLFLDEVGDMSLMTQAKTLRALAEGYVEHIGGRAPIPVDVRVIAATNKNLELEMRDGNFREDLFYRLNVITISMPPLRERREDIPALVDHFLAHHAVANDLVARKLERGALNLLVEDDWPGNIRQLRNVIERLTVLSEGATITTRNVIQALRRRQGVVASTRHANLREAREQFEREFILKTLVTHAWKIQEAAAVLGIDRSHLWKKMRQFGLEHPA